MDGDKVVACVLWFEKRLDDLRRAGESALSCFPDVLSRSSKSRALEWLLAISSSSSKIWNNLGLQNPIVTHRSQYRYPMYLLRKGLPKRLVENFSNAYRVTNIDNALNLLTVFGRVSMTLSAVAVTASLNVEAWISFDCLS